MPEEELNNLARIGMLDKVPFSAALLQKMLATIASNASAPDEPSGRWNSSLASSHTPATSTSAAAPASR